MRNDDIMCMLCGEWFQTLVSHLKFKHKMTATEYKEMQGLDRTKGLTSTSYKERNAKRVKDLGIYLKNLENGKKSRFVKGDKRAGNYERSDETKERLLKLHETTPIAKAKKEVSEGD